jgi:hypothetical protein
MIFRFVCDHDVDAAVAMMLRKAGHEGMHSGRRGSLSGW